MRMMDGPIALLPCVSLNYYASCEECDESTCTIKPVFEKVRDQNLAVLETRRLKLMRMTTPFFPPTTFKICALTSVKRISAKTMDIITPKGPHARCKAVVGQGQLEHPKAHQVDVGRCFSISSAIEGLY